MEIATYKKYLDQLNEEFPDIDKKSIRDVVRHGLALVGLFRTNNHDIYLNNNQEGLYYYFGEVTNKPERRYELSNKKVRKKLRMVYKLKKTKYDGYFYFSLTDEDYKKHLAGEKISKLFLYKVKQEATLYEPASHMFRLAIEENKEFYISYEDYLTDKAEEINNKV